MGAIFLLLPIVLLLGLVAGIFLWATSGPRSKNNEMSCGACGYAVRGLEGVNCPECGADLREVGINRPSGGSARSMGVMLTIACGGILVAGFLGSIFFLAGSNAPPPSSPATQTVPSQPPGLNTPSSDPLESDVESPDDETQNSLGGQPNEASGSSSQP